MINMCLVHLIKYYLFPLDLFHSFYSYHYFCSNHRNKLYYKRYNIFIILFFVVLLQFIYIYHIYVQLQDQIFIQNQILMKKQESQLTQIKIMNIKSIIKLIVRFYKNGIVFYIYLLVFIIHHYNFQQLIVSIIIMVLNIVLLLFI